ncbi:hypothetical protein FUAX_41890 (plasmid) [Fulvitalea axinellae]|uniref:Lin1244/Lin1753-like N-terminal domain-containing protein n=1 Tax=Fulvitalea axinellae TaxID=1182444 RepID=A0AAU9CUU3_9BACT|nr:hypothetical protein FUAX_41890 [Fulvitalea axinellae]
MKKDAYYFSHDSNACHDQKIRLMLAEYGAEGYGWYWMLVELMRDESDHQLLRKGRGFLKALAHELHTDADKLAPFLDDCVNEYGLFREEDDYLWSDSLLERMAQVESKSQRRKDAANSRWSKKEEPRKKANNKARIQKNKADNVESGCKTDAMHMHCDTMKENESKGKQTKKNEIIEKETKGDTHAPEVAIIPELPFHSQEFNNLWDDWRHHLQTMGKAYRSPLLEKRALDRLRPYDEEFATELVEKALIKGWTDFHFEATPGRWKQVQNQKSRNREKNASNNACTGAFSAADLAYAFERIDAMHPEN